MTIHSLKTVPSVFEHVWLGKKHHEVRKNDRDFKEGDMLVLREHETETGFTGRVIECHVSYITVGPNWGLPPGLCVMSIDRTVRFREPPISAYCPKEGA